MPGVLNPLSSFTDFISSFGSSGSSGSSGVLGLSDSSRINIVLRSQKKNYVMTSVGGKPAVLIDDYPKNIKEWTAKGGMGILHTTTSSTISQLRKIGI